MVSFTVNLEEMSSVRAQDNELLEGGRKCKQRKQPQLKLKAPKRVALLRK